MGLFVQRPEEPSEWAGLPGEPARPRTRAELLPDDDPPAASPTGLLGLGGTSTTSLEIPLHDPADAGDTD
ncbi:hypothetical protein QE410_001753 [Microbacterium sp. SORGH_AS 1204]|uniref:hypothetical protein n=1 Tax=Microbacterium sp. SORGH_AS_1204 TaxID=3041785 RepID=UPI0027939E1D|nr:hypothetical protein [Microbacterium sp. SORGH_AS_1204]MDQ1136954.1 hypothetical protein [Microbacterium sp. SORGH_AS_1204]